MGQLLVPAKVGGQHLLRLEHGAHGGLVIRTVLLAVFVDIIVHEPFWRERRSFFNSFENGLRHGKPFACLQNIVYRPPRDSEGQP